MAVQKKRGRPTLTSAQTDEMRARVAAAAAELFRTEGYAAVSIRRLATEVGCSPMTLYKYYESKVDILRHLWSAVFDELFDAVDAAAGRKRAPARRLEAMAKAYVEYWLGHTENFRMVFMSEGVTQPEVSVFVSDSPIVARYAVLLDALADAASLDRDSAELKARGDALICALNGIAMSMITISGYEWTTASKMTAALVAQAVGE